MPTVYVHEKIDGIMESVYIYLYINTSEFLDYSFAHGFY